MPFFFQKRARALIKKIKGDKSKEKSNRKKPKEITDPSRKITRGPISNVEHGALTTPVPKTTQEINAELKDLLFQEIIDEHFTR